MKGQMVVLNGAPRSGKTSLVREIQETFPGCWLNFGVDVWNSGVIPKSLLPGLGLRPGEQIRTIEERLPALYRGLYESALTHCRLGFNIVVDVGHHDSYSQPLGILLDCAQIVSQTEAWLIGVTCSLEAVLERRRISQKEGGPYLASQPGDPPPLPVVLWQEEVHKHGLYDLVVNTEVNSPQEAAQQILDLISSGDPPRAFGELALRKSSGADFP